MNIVEFFDPRSKVHLEAFKYISETGRWPEGFLPNAIEFPNLWQIALVSKIADCWIEQELGISMKPGKRPMTITPFGIDSPK
jgi:hypothetical protein